MSDQNIKFIDIRLIACKALLVQLLKLIGYIQYSLDNSSNDSETIITIKIKNRHKIKLSAAVNDTNIVALPHNGTISIGD
jgi:hypothetical protein